jgi:hypothetical protein
MMGGTGVAELCCARPSVMIFDGQGNKIGNVEDPYHPPSVLNICRDYSATL